MPVPASADRALRVSQVASRARTTAGRPVRVVVLPLKETTKAKTTSVGSTVRNAVASTVAGTAAHTALRFGAPAALGAATGLAAARSQRPKKRPAKRVSKAFGAGQAQTKPKTDTKGYWGSDEKQLRNQKKVQGVLGTTAAGIGTAAFGMKGATKVLPHLPKLRQPQVKPLMHGARSLGKPKGQEYADKLDGMATHLLFGGAGVGGASGLHQSQIYRQEGKKKLPGDKRAPVAKARQFDPEGRRMKRLKAYEVGAGASSVGLAAAAARPNTAVAIRGRAGAAKVAERAKVAEAEGRRLLGGPRPAPAQARAKYDEARKLSASAKKIVSLHPSVVPTKQRVALGAGAAAAGGATVAVNRYRRSESGQPYRKGKPYRVGKAAPDQSAVHVAVPLGHRPKKRAEVRKRF